MRFLNVLQALWCEPWLILPEMHRTMCEVVRAHMDGSAHAEGSIASLIELDPKQAENAQEYAVVDGIAYMSLEGSIGKRLGMLEKSSGACDLDDLGAMLERAEADPGVEGVLLDVNSPGGRTVGVPEAWETLQNMQTPVVAYTDTLMASAAYWIASGADAIYASGSATVGNIGAYLAWLDKSRRMEMEGYKLELIKHGKFKGMGIPGSQLSNEQRATLQARVDGIYEWFAACVSEGRDVAAEAMEGQTFHGREAVRYGLVDAVGSMDDAVEELKDMIG